MKFYIETERLILRELQANDAKAFFEMDSNSLVHKYLGNEPIKTREHIHEVIANIQQQYLDNGIGRWAIIEKSSGNFIGWSGVKFRRDEENKHINFYDVGYRLMPEYWGRGYATESCKVALEYGFLILNAKEIIGTANEQNKASLRVLEKCGLKFVEKFMWKDIKCDWLKITKDDWENQINNLCK
jgi:RimJ/RimL family protein N-acetyltransferase